MKTFLCALLLLGGIADLHAQTYSEKDFEPTKAMTFGFLKGGGSLVGMDLEILLDKQIGLQFGCGMVGYGAGFNVHFKPTIHSSFFSFQYWHQGVWDTFTQSAVGPSVVFRKKWISAQLGLGVPLKKGPAFPENIEQPPVMLLYSLGFYIAHR